MGTAATRGSRAIRWLPLVLIGAGALVRIAAVAAWSGHLAEDRDDYWTVAHAYLNFGFWSPFERLPSSFRPPLYPLALAGLLKLGGGTTALGVLQIVLGTVSVWLTLVAGRRLALGKWASVAAACVAFDPLLIVYTTFPMTETLFTFLVIALVVAATANRQSLWQAAGVGILFGASALCRPTIWPTAALAAVCVIAGTLRTHRPWKPLIVPALVAAMACGVVVAPWALRNRKILGSPILTTTHGGYTLLLGNNPEFFRDVASRPLSEVWTDREPDRFQQSWFNGLIADRDREIGPAADEVTQNRWMYDRAWRSIAAEPRLFARACALKFVLFWNVAPQAPSRSSLSRLVVWAVCVGYVIELSLFVIGLVSLARHWDARWTLSLCVILTFTLAHLLYWSNMRMRAPLVPLIGLVAAHGLATFLDRRKVNKLVSGQGPISQP